MHEVDPDPRLEQLDADARCAAEPGRGVVERTGLRLGEVDEFLEALRAGFRVHHQDARYDRKLGDAGEILDGVECQVGVEALDHGMPVGDKQQRMAVGRGLGGRRRAGEAGLVLHDHVAPPDLLELVRIGAAENVGLAAGRERHHDAHELTRIGLRRGRRRADAGGKDLDCRCGKRNESGGAEAFMHGRRHVGPLPASIYL